MTTRRGKAAPVFLDASGVRLGIVLSDYHGALSEGLLEGARRCLRSHRVTVESVPVFRVPGAFEVPQAVSRILSRHEPPLEAVVALGVLIRGETLHFELLSQEVCRRLGEIARSEGVPVAFGVLTVDSERQARDRTGPGRSNKGWEAAHAAVRMALLFRRLAGGGESEKDPASSRHRRAGR